MYWIERISQQNASDMRKFWNEVSHINRVLYVEGEPGTGKSSLVHRSLGLWKNEGDAVVVFNENKPLKSNSDLIKLLLRNFSIEQSFPGVNFLARQYFKFQDLNLVEFFSNIYRPEIYLDQISKAVIDDINNLKTIWLIFDNAAASDNALIDWFYSLFQSPELRIGFQIVFIGSDLVKPQFSGVSILEKSIRLERFSHEELLQFCSQSNNAETAIGMLDLEQIEFLTLGNPLWLQYLASCPKKWFQQNPVSKNLPDGILLHLANRTQVDFLSQLALCQNINDRIINNITDDKLDVSWLSSVSEFMASNEGGFQLHPLFKDSILQGILDNHAPATETEYRQHLTNRFLKAWTSQTTGHESIDSILLLGNLMNTIQTEKEVLTCKQLIHSLLLETFLLRPFQLNKLRSSNNPIIVQVKKILLSMRSRDWYGLAVAWQSFFEDYKFSYSEKLADKLALQGLFLFFADKNLEAENIFNECLEQNPKEYLAYWGRGLIFQDRKNTQAAIQEFSKSIECRSDFAPAYNERGACYFSKADNDKALNDFEYAIEIYPSYVHALANIGILYFRKNDLEMASRMFVKALSIDAEETKAYVYLVAKLNIDNIVRLN